MHTVLYYTYRKCIFCYAYEIANSTNEKRVENASRETVATLQDKKIKLYANSAVENKNKFGRYVKVSSTRRD